MKKILFISTGGTFNKIYNPVSGELEIDQTSSAVHDIAEKWLFDFEVVHIIGKDSMEMNNTDRLLLLATINLSKEDDIIIIHGTDTMEQTAQYLADSELDRRVVLTGAMVPYSIDPVEAAANLASAYGFLQRCEKSGIYISMNGIIESYHAVTKNRKAGRFVLSEE